MRQKMFLNLKVFWRLLVSLSMAALLILIVLLARSPGGLKARTYDWVRETMKKSMEIKTYNWYALEGEYFRVKYQPVDASIARLVLETAEASFSDVNKLLDFEPKMTVPIFIYPNRVSLSKSFGWDGAINAMGVYWAGAIRILSPLEWIDIDNEESLIATFQEQGPIVHEYAHLLVDYKTHGNYPRWFTEGVAQYVEQKLTGYLLPEPVGEENLWYSFSKMDDKFDLLPNQDVAYRQSLLAVEYIVELKGFGAILAILDELAKGQTIKIAVESTTGLSFDDFEKSFKTLKID
ncbi:MAG: hypothetical protein WDA53_06015 [Bacillota bacterium]